MNEPIKEGDLVIVIRGCRYCGDTSDLGLTFIAGAIKDSWGEMTCCGDGANDSEVVAMSASDEGFPLAMLKRIPPLPELESEKHEEETNA